MMSKHPLQIVAAIYAVIFIAVFILLGNDALAQTKPKSKFYDFGEQVIDGEIKKPTALYTDSKKKVKFDRLLKLKKSFIPELLKTSEEKTFKWVSTQANGTTS